MNKGYYIRMYGKDCFIITDKQKRTKLLAIDFISKVHEKINIETHKPTDKEVEYVQKNMRSSTFEIKTIEKGNFKGLSYYVIAGENFSFSCDACKNPLDFVHIVE